MPDMDFKTISVCNECGSVDRYANGQCKPCTRAKHSAWRAANPEKMKAYGATYRAANHEKLTAASLAWGVIYRAKNPEKEKAKKAAWAKANPEAIRIKGQARRAKKRGSHGTLSKGLSKRLFKLQKGKCPCCNQPLGDNYHMDHIMPLALGGSNTDGNIQLLRQFCNLQKSVKHPVDFMQSRGFLL